MNDKDLAPHHDVTGARKQEVKTEALRLSELLMKHVIPNGMRHEAAAELRRLHAVEQQRDELLKALNAMLTHMGMDEDEWSKATYDQARAAIAKCGGASP